MLTPPDMRSLVFLALAGCGAALQHPATPDLATRERAFAALLGEQWQWTMRSNPEYASYVGDHRYDDRLSDRSEAANLEHIAKDRDFLARFHAIDTTGFPEQDALSARLMVRSLEDEIEGAKFRYWLMPVDQLDGPQMDFPQLVPSLRFANADDYRHYVARIDAWIKRGGGPR